MDIFIVKTSDADNIKSELLDEYSHRDFMNAGKRKEHCFSYLIADRILKEVYKINNRKIELINNKPYLISREKFFSISHSYDYIAITFSDFDCGIDIEKIVERDYKAISKRMKFSSATLEEFYKNWTKYEAEFKLGKKAESIYQTKYENYAITAVSVNIQEHFVLYIQNGETFSNL